MVYERVWSGSVGVNISSEPGLLILGLHERDDQTEPGHGRIVMTPDQAERLIERLQEQIRRARDGHVSADASGPR